MMKRLCWTFYAAFVSLTLFATSISAYGNGMYSASAFEARLFFKRENELLRQRKRAENLAAYTFNTNVTEANHQAMLAIAFANAAAAKDLALRILRAGYDQIEDEFIQRQVKILGNLGFNVLPPKDFNDLQSAITNMEVNYASATVCAYQNPTVCGLSLEPFIQERLANSRDPAELAYYWTQWHDVAGTPMRDNFTTYVNLTHKAARLNFLSSYADYWIKLYDDPAFEANIDAVFKALVPFYTEMHGYVRYKLLQQYGPDVVSPRGNIPIHLLGNMWGQSWENVIDLLAPFPDKPFVDVTAEMLRQGITVRRLIELGDEFFKSLNMRALPDSFLNLSVLVRPIDRPVICQASAWDLYQDSDVRIKMCTELNQQYLLIAHHELGHIQYFLQYEKQPTAFRGAPNPGFHEAVGDTIVLSAASAKHLQKIGLLATAVLDEESRINELFKLAAKKLPLLPFAYTLDKWRFAVFRGELEPSVWNCGFWQMRSEFSGIEPPVVRTDLDFDPPAKYHVDADVEYLRFFVAGVAQFQFHKALCIKAGQYRPNSLRATLDNCDISGSAAAGRIFSKFLSLGDSVHWKEALELLTGDTSLNPIPLLEYFKPLFVWLKRENRRLGVPLGWDATDKVAPNCCPPFST